MADADQQLSDRTQAVIAAHAVANEKNIGEANADKSKADMHEDPFNSVDEADYEALAARAEARAEAEIEAEAEAEADKGKEVDPSDHVAANLRPVVGSRPSRRH